MNNELKDRQVGKRSTSLLGKLMLMSAGSIFLLLVLAIAAMWRMGARFFDEVGAMFNPHLSAPQVDIRTVVIQQIQGVSELTTAVFVMEAVVPAEQDLLLGKFTVGTTKLLYIARGEVRAGIDLAKLEPKDIDVSDSAISIRLPPPSILDRKIDVAHSRVYDYNRGFLGLGPDTGPSLQELAQKETLRRITAAACSDGVLDRANERAELVVSRLVNMVGEKKVIVKTQTPASDACN